jgi:hypothetical protein
MSIFLTNFPDHSYSPSLLCFVSRIFVHNQNRWPFVLIHYLQSVLRKLTVMGYVPQLLDVYTVSIHISVFPIYLESKKTGILHEKCVHFQRQEDISVNRRRDVVKLYIQIVWRHINCKILTQTHFFTLSRAHKRCDPSSYSKGMKSVADCTEIEIIPCRAQSYSNKAVPPLE